MFHYIADVARTAEVYAKRQRMSVDVVRQATAIKTDAIALMGEFLQGADKQHGSRGSGKSGVPLGNSTPNLGEVGITKKESMNAQAIRV